ncbi:MAG TPA: choice-of-anchor Q domain-containing protein [Trebonia sp.]|jgi:hypothetical protein|nr:choice-of-anchor Q domain-containing protein [Trebonia sp.]
MRLRSRLSVGLAVAAAGLATAAVIVPRVGPTGDAAAAVTATQAAATSAVRYTPYPSTGTDLYVDSYKVDGIGDCSDSGPGSESDPFCTIAEAASVVQPGQTVVVEPGDYTNTTISVSGTAQAPITFDAIGSVTVDDVSNEPTLTISGAHHVVLDGFSADSVQRAFYVTGGSSNITINGGFADGPSALTAAIEVDGTTSDVTVSRMSIEGRMPVVVDPGASGVVITGNSIQPDLLNTYGVLVNGAPGTDVVGNTIHASCSGGISIKGASTSVSVENNIVQPVALTGGGTPCVGTGISVSADSEAGSVLDYNLIDPSAGEPPYNWGGTSYTSLAAFQAASQQGAHDIVANPDLGQETAGPKLLPGSYVFWFPLQAGSPAIDSANSNAPGALPTDQFGDPRTDDPNVPNTGVGYYDRGAMELEGGPTTGPDASAASTGTLTATWKLGYTSAWPTNGPLMTVVVSFGDGTPAEVGYATSVPHTYSTTGPHAVAYQFFGDSFGYKSGTDQVVVGADYTPISPDRILDTRVGTGTGKIAPIGAKGKLTLSIPTVGGVPAAHMSAVVMNVTVTSPTRSGNLTVYPGSGSAPTVSNHNFSAAETVPNLVTVQVSNGQVSFYNNSGGTVEVVADLQGFYGPSGYGYQPGTPARVLDTRIGTGVKGPVAAMGVLRLNLSGKVPAGAAAAVINLTVTDPQKSGHLTAYPDGTHAPNTSNLNFSAGETVPNLVIVPLTNDIADIANASPGTVQMVADLEGYFSSSAPDSFVPISPTRELDTRTTGSALAAGKAITMNILTDAGQTAAAMVDNVTVVSPAKIGNLIVYPAGQSRPVVSNLNFKVNETVPNLVIAKGGTSAQVSYYNNSPGKIQLIVDEYGFYMNAG